MKKANQTFTLMQKAVGFHQTSQLAEAERVYREVLTAEPQHGDALRFLGSLYMQDNRPDAAIECFEKARTVTPRNPELLNNLGVALYSLGKTIDAQKAYEEAVRLDPNYWNAALNLANLLLATGQRDEAVPWLRRVVEVRQDHIQALTQLGNLLRATGESEEACTIYRRLVDLQPDDVNVHVNLGTLYHDLSKWDDALAQYDKALSLQADYTDALVSRAGLLMELNRPNEAKAAYAQIIKAEPARRDALFGQSMALLTLGEYKEGWPLYESRYQHAPHLLAYSKDRWDGSPLDGKRLLIWGEQGLGDVLQFVRYAALCKEKGGHIIVQCKQPLVRLLQNCSYIDEVVTQISEKDFDYQISMMSLPAIFATTLDTIPKTIPYLFVSEEARAKWAPCFANIDGYKIGLVWAGNPRKNRIDAHITDRQRSLKLAMLKPLLESEGVRFYSLQKGDAANEIKSGGLSEALIDYTDDIQDFMDTAALIENLDLVISVDTSVVHLAGGLGKPVWVLSRFGGCWRWLGNQSDSPWYPTARVFAPPAPADWQPCIQDVCVALKEKIAAT
jgi:tetratricopeptide (TPR) repeat protein